MSGSRLSAYERLQRLRPAGPPVAPEDEDALDGPFGPPPLAGAPPEPPPGPPASALEGLERRLLGAPGEGLTLRERLQRLAEAAARRQPAPGLGPPRSRSWSRASASPTSAASSS